ncbi:MAG: agmatinase family protein [Firmicutes bacterium]|nr:agmatinase family protein [Bacillota bacterium]HPU01277.1 agmatinase family protein [Bacillota bacterium]
MNEPKIFFGAADAPKRIAILGVPFDSASTLGWPGARYAPARIRTALGWNLNRVQDGAFYDVDAGRVICMNDYAVVDYGDCFVHGADHLKTLENARQLMAAALQAGAFPIALGGAHEVSIPLLQAFHDCTEGPLGIIHVDAHLDLVDENPRQGRHSGSSPMRRALEMGRYSPQRLVQVGVRGFNYAHQYDYIQRMGIHHVTASRFHEIGAKEAAQLALEKAAAGGARVYLSLDIDVFDYPFAPGAGADEAGGLISAQVLQFLREVAPHIGAMDIVEVNPLIDRRDVTSSLAAQIIFTVIAARVAAGV